MGLTIQSWYMSLNLPVWAPPVWLFGIAWAVIYPLIIVSFGYVFWHSFVTHRLRRYVGALFAINLVCNLIYGIGTYAVFSEGQMLSEIKQFYVPAALVISCVLVTIPFLMITTWDKARWVALMQIPYLAWVSLATVLQYTINFTN